jgi:DNA-binding response OmpR family regulator
VLARAGYRVLTATSGNEALRLLAEPGLHVDLVLTDLIMPGGVSGQELGRKLCERYAELRILYMSGYTGGSGQSDVADRFHLPAGAQLLAKPFTPAKLLESVRACLSGS